MSKINNLIQRIKSIPYRIEALYKNYLYPPATNDTKDSRVLVGKLLSQLNNQKNEINKLSEVEYKVFSQFGDDGIIQYLINKIDIPNHSFIEFGVENYKESNTRFLLINDNWSGLVIDGSADNINYINNDIISSYHELHAIHSFITAENINELIAQFLSLGFNKEIGLLSIDIDGNDYWVWKAITIIEPIIVVVEYNSLLGAEKSLTIPYDGNFVRNTKHNIMYWGSSLNAFVTLASKKNYAFIGCNAAGNNAYFVRKDKLNSAIKECTIEKGFVLSKFRETINEQTNLKPFGRERATFLKGLPFYNIDTETIESF
jgi:hypothetical protein